MTTFVTATVPFITATGGCEGAIQSYCGAKMQYCERDHIHLRWIGPETVKRQKERGRIELEDTKEARQRNASHVVVSY